VRDTGIGIEPAAIRKLFRRFSQANSGIAANYGGSGLGLSLVRETVHFLGGHVSVESTVGGGTCFHLSFPVEVPTEAERQQFIAAANAKANHAFITAAALRSSDSIPLIFSPTANAGYLSRGSPLPDALLRRLSSGSSQSSAPPPLVQTREIFRVLIVDDNIVNQRLLSGILSRLSNVGFEVAGDGIEALRKLGLSDVAGEVTGQALKSAGEPLPLGRIPNFHAILLDVEMPKLDGVEVARVIRAFEEQTIAACVAIDRMCIVMLTGNASSQTREKCTKIGVNAYLLKPFDRTQLVRILNGFAAKLGVNIDAPHSRASSLGGASSTGLNATGAGEGQSGKTGGIATPDLDDRSASLNE
jgi:CheY-like chemotaxis protein